MMESGKGRRTLRHFYCRDELWSACERMSNEFSCSIDYIVNEAVRSYAAGMGFQSAVPPKPAIPGAIKGTPVPDPSRLPLPVPSPTLHLLFEGRRIAIDKEQFIIGRMAEYANLQIHDCEVSRRHAAVIRRGESFYLRDLGSTNGVSYEGLRIEEKRIDEGDVFVICGKEIRFTYR